MSKFRKKPVVIDAFRFYEKLFIKYAPSEFDYAVCKCLGHPHIHSGGMTFPVRDGSWIVEDASGGFCVIENQMFEKNYEAVPGVEPAQEVGPMMAVSDLRAELPATQVALAIPIQSFRR